MIKTDRLLLAMHAIHILHLPDEYELMDNIRTARRRALLNEEAGAMECIAETIADLEAVSVLHPKAASVIGFLNQSLGKE